MSHVYQVKAKWLEDVKGRLEAGKNAFDFSVPLDFGGPEGYFSPEELFAASVVTCLCTTFWNTLKKMRVKLMECEVEGNTSLQPDPEGFHFTDVVVKLKAKVEDSKMVEQAKKAWEKAEKRCFVSRALKGNVGVKVEASIS